MCPSSNVHPMQTRGKSGISKKKVFHIDASLSEPKPSCFTEANKSPKWRQVMADEFSALEQQGTWSPVSPTPNMNVIGCKWTFRINYTPDGTVLRYKVRLVAKGYPQIEGVDFEDTFSLLIKKTTIRDIKLSW